METEPCPNCLSGMDLSGMDIDIEDFSKCVVCKGSGEVPRETVKATLWEPDTLPCAICGEEHEREECGPDREWSDL